MLCRRCGMESSTTDVCEWCNRPMLPTGSAVIVPPGNAPPPAAQPPDAPPPGMQSLANGDPESEPAPVASQQSSDDILLHPLGHTDGHLGQASAAPQPPPPKSGPSHGLTDDATRTSIDISQYMGTEQSIFRPIEKDDGFASASSLDRVTQKKTYSQQATGPNWTENQRLARCAIAGIVIGVIFALAGYLISGQTPTMIATVIPVGGSASILTALKFGVLSGLMLGFMLGALLVRLQKGSFAGMLAGIVLGAFALSNGIYGILAGAISGIIVGRFATIGVRRVINV